jgi:hypothetical protein
MAPKKRLIAERRMQARESWTPPVDQRPVHRASRAPMPPPRLSFVARHRSRQVRLYVGRT